MFPSLEKNPAFVKEWTEWNSKVLEFPEGQIKTEVMKLLNELLREVRHLDSLHLEIFNSNQIPAVTPETRANITEIRKKIARRMAEWEKIKSTQSF